MREGWKQYDLGDIGTITKGTSPTMKTAPGQYPLIVTAAEPLSSGEYQFEGEAVCIPMVSSTGHGHASLKRVHYASGKFAVANIIAAVQVKDASAVSTRFLSLYLQHYKDELIVTRMRGTANVSLSLGGLATIPVVLPPLEDQQRIIDLIGSLDEAIEAADTATEMARRSVNELRRRLLTPKEEWHKATVEEMCHKITSGGTPNRNVPGLYTDEPTGIPWVKTSELLGGVINDTSEHITVEAVAGSSAKLLPAGTVLMAMYCIGTLGSVGILGREMACNQASCAMIPNTELVLPEILSYLLANDRAHLENISTGAAQRNINARTVKALSYSLPGLAEQREIVDLVGAADVVVKGSEAAATSLRVTRSALLTVLLSGEHEIPESYDIDTAVQLEPAA